MYVCCPSDLSYYVMSVWPVISTCYTRPDCFVCLSCPSACPVLCVFLYFPLPSICPACLSCHVLFVLSYPVCQSCHISLLRSVLSCLIMSVSLSCQTVCLFCPVLMFCPVLSVLSCILCPVLFRFIIWWSVPVCLHICLIPSILSVLYCPTCHVLYVLSCRACPVCESCHARPVSCFLLSCLSACKLCSVLSVLSCHMSLSCQQCPVCSALPYAVNPVLSLGSYLPCDVAPILSCLLGNALLVLFCTVLSGPVRSSLSCLFGSVHHVMSICLSYISSWSACLRSLCGLRLLHLPRFLSDLLTYSSFFFFSDTKPNAVVDFS